MIPPRVEAQLRADLKAEQEAKLKAREAKMARLARMQRKGVGDDASAAALRKQAEKLFVRGLIDSCPRCGFEPGRGEADSESLAEHLRTCTDARSHAKHAASVAAAAEKAGKTAARQEAQEDAQNEASWKFLGGGTEQMWLLTDKALERQCKERGLDGGGSREEMLTSLAQAEAQSSGRLLTHAGGDAVPSGGGGGKRPKTGHAPVSRASLPDNLHAMSLSQLRAVAAVHGVSCDPAAGVDDIIAQLERAADDGRDEPLRLEDKGRGSKASGKKRAVADVDAEYVHVDDDDD